VDAAINEARLTAVRNKVRLEVSGEWPAVDFKNCDKLLAPTEYLKSRCSSSPTRIDYYTLES